MSKPEESTPLLATAPRDDQPGRLGGDSTSPNSEKKEKKPKQMSKEPVKAESKWNDVRKKIEGGSFLLDQGNITAANSTASSTDAFDFQNLTKFSMKECLLVIVGYLLLGIIAYSYVFEEWPIIDSIYFSVVTFTTVGYGDIYPESDAGRIFTSFYVFTSIAFVSIALGALTEELVAMSDTAKKTNEEEAKSEVMSLFSSDDPSVKEEDKPQMTELRNQEDYCNKILVYAGIIGFICVGGFLVGNEMGWDLIEIIYFTTITMTTVGYGDFTPKDDTSKLCSIVFIPVSVGCIGYLLGQIAVSMTERRIQAAKEKLLNRKVTLEDLQKMDADQSGQVSELEFLLFMLLQMGQVEKPLIDELRKQFDALDATREGTLDRNDLIEHARKRLKTDVRTKLGLASYKKELIQKSQYSAHV